MWLAVRGVTHLLHFAVVFILLCGLHRVTAPVRPKSVHDACKTVNIKQPKGGLSQFEVSVLSPSSHEYAGMACLMCGGGVDV